MMESGLASEVLGRKVGVPFRQNENTIGIMDGEIWLSFNKYEWAHMCKEWAHKKGYWLSTCYTGEVKIYQAGSTYPEETRHIEIKEPEGIFEACQYLFNKENK